MNITGIIWLRDVVYKLWWKHKITTDEVEEVFANEPRYKFQEIIAARDMERKERIQYVRK